MDTGRSTTFAGGLKLASEGPIEESGCLGTRRSKINIRWYEYTFFVLGVLATIVTDGLTIFRLIDLGRLNEPEFAYGILIIVHSIFLLIFLITGLLYQRVSDIVAFFLSDLLLTVYVIAHYFTPRHEEANPDKTQANIRLVRLIFTVAFNLCFAPHTYFVIKYYNRDEFSKRIFGTFPAARRPFKIYTTFDCVARINTMLCITSLLLNLYNYTNTTALDIIFLCVGIPLTFLWLGVGIGMARLENTILLIIFYILSLFQIGFLIYILYIGIEQQQKSERSSTTTTQASSTQAPVVNMIPVLTVLYVCVAANFLTHIMSMVMAYWCKRNFNNGLREKVFNTKLDKWFQHRWSNN